MKENQRLRGEVTRCQNGWEAAEHRAKTAEEELRAMRKKLGRVQKAIGAAAREAATDEPSEQPATE
jgi:hypothetical protein